MRQRSFEFLTSENDGIDIIDFQITKEEEGKVRRI